MKVHSKFIQAFSALLITALLVAVLQSGLVKAATNLVPPVGLGPKTLSGAGDGSALGHEFFLQPGSSWKGDIGGIVAGPTYSLVVLNIDLTGVTGSGGRTIYFNLQDAETGSTFKNLGINVILQQLGSGGTALLQAYQSFTSDGFSSHGFNAGELTEGDLGLRFDFTKAVTGDGWTVTPYFRLGNGSWNQFYDGPFVSTIPFDFLGAKLVVGFDGSADGTVSFSDYYIDGPPQLNFYYFPLFISD